MLLKNALKKIDHVFFGSLPEHYSGLLERELVGSCESVLDVACGSSSPISRFSRKIPLTVGIDGFQPSIEKSRLQGIHSEYRLMNVMDLEREFEAKSFDAVI